MAEARSRRGKEPFRGPAPQAGGRPGPPRELAARLRGPPPIPPSEYSWHLEREHGLLVAPEPGWPTEVKRFRLARPAGGGRSEQVLATFVGTRPQALAHFYRYLHPPRREGLAREALPRAA